MLKENVRLSAWLAADPLWNPRVIWSNILTCLSLSLDVLARDPRYFGCAIMPIGWIPSIDEPYHNKGNGQNRVYPIIFGQKRVVPEIFRETDCRGRF